MLKTDKALPKYIRCAQKLGGDGPAEHSAMTHSAMTSTQHLVYGNFLKKDNHGNDK